MVWRGFFELWQLMGPTKNILRDALYYQVFDRFEPPVNPPCSASRSTAVFHSSWCRPSRGGIVSAKKMKTKCALLLVPFRKTPLPFALQHSTFKTVKSSRAPPARNVAPSAPQT